MLRNNEREVATLFLKLGFTAFGGPAAHIAIMHDEVVKRRKWLSEEEFLDLVGATNLIPGPNSTEMAIHLGYRRAGWRGLVLAGVCFILPAMLIVLALAWAYARFGAAPQANWLLNGVKPVVIAIVLQALWGLGRKAIKSTLTAMTAIGVFAFYFLGVNELLLLLGGGLLVMIALNLRRLSGSITAAFLLPVGGLIAQVPPSPNLGGLFLTLLKIGSVLYGSGYVLLAFLHNDFVMRLGWLSDQQLIDAVAIGQLTPGPVFTTATFIGYLIQGFPGAIVATVGIFLPSFLFVALTHPLIPCLRRSRWFSGLLDGVNAASLGLMGAVTFVLGRAALVDGRSILIGMIAFVLLVRFKVNTTWLILGGALVGVVTNYFFYIR